MQEHIKLLRYQAVEQNVSSIIKNRLDTIFMYSSSITANWQNLPGNNKFHL